LTSFDKNKKRLGKQERKKTKRNRNQERKKETKERKSKKKEKKKEMKYERKKDSFFNWIFLIGFPYTYGHSCKDCT